jgi:hypothetical protein
MDSIVFGFVGARRGDVDELQHKRSSCHDAAAAREEVLANNVFEHGGFAGGLGADCDLCVVLATTRHHIYMVRYEQSEGDLGNHCRWC